jgi:hypothetical protein
LKIVRRWRSHICRCLPSLSFGSLGLGMFGAAWPCAVVVGMLLAIATRGDGQGDAQPSAQQPGEEHDAVLNKYYYSTLNRRGNVFVCNATDERLHVSRVDDGICDCCDGSDEPNKAWCKSARTCPTDRLSNYRQLKEWMIRGGANVDKLDAGVFEIPQHPGMNHIGLRTHRNARRGDVLMSVPEKLVFSANALDLDTEAGKWIAAVRPALGQHAYLALVLLHEMSVYKGKGTGYRFGSWLSTLPLFVKSVVHDRRVNSFLAAQQPASSLLLDMNNDALTTVFTSYRTIQNLLLTKAPNALFPSRKYSVGRYVYAYTLVNSRSFMLDLQRGVGSGASLELVMIPFVDLMNHHHEAVSKDADGQAAPQFVFDGASRQIKVYAGADYAVGNEIFLSYGATSNPVPGFITDGGNGGNAHNIHHYGFMPVENPSETVHVGLEFLLKNDQSSCGGVTSHGHMESWREGLLLNHSLGHIHFLSFTLDGVVSAQERQALRVWTLCPDQTVHIGAEELRRRMEANEPLDEANEVAVDYMIMMSLEQLLRDHQTDLDADVTLVKGISRLRHPDFFNAVSYVIAVKRILHASLLGSMKTLYETYRRAAGAWMERAEGDEAMQGHKDNVQNYVDWIHDLNTWRTSYLEWKRALRGVL